jgi:hypothetical protein
MGIIISFLLILMWLLLIVGINMLYSTILLIIKKLIKAIKRE